jgi:hypothetical protein
MKNQKYILSVLAILLTCSSCDKKMEKMNTNPLALSEIPDEYLFTSAIRQTFGGSAAYVLRFPCQYAHIYVTNNENRAADGYLDFHSQDVYKEMFAGAYIDALRYINEVLIMTSEGKYQNEVRNAIAQIVSIINYAQATDCWGNIPYSEGAKGSSGILYPKYDTQEFIYHDMMDKLKTCIGILETADPQKGYVGSDPVYNNDLSKWTRFANSLRLRFAMKTRFADPENSAIVINECMAGPLIETNDQNFELKHQESENSELYNPWFDLRKYSNFKMSEKFTNWLISTNDPRLKIFVDTISTGIRKGVPNGLTDQAYSLVDWNNISNPMPVLYSKSLSQYLMCASEIWFLRAEAALYKLAPGDPDQLYKQGITLNMQLWKVSTTETTDFLINEPESTLNGTDENKFRQIATQMWIAFIPNFMEAWTNIRRTGYPEIPQRTNPDVYSLGVTNGFLPKRYKYSSSEYLNNHNNVTEAVSQQGPDKIDTPVWWDVRGN